MQSILCRSVESSALAIEVEAAFSAQSAQHVARYGLTISANQGTQPLSVREVLSCEDVTQGRVEQFKADQGEVKWLADGVSPVSSRFARFAADHLCLGVLREPPFLELADGLRYMGIHTFHPEAIRRLQRRTVGYLLERDGSNLPGVIAMLQE